MRRVLIFAGILVVMFCTVGAERAVIWDLTEKKYETRTALPVELGGTNSTTQNFVDLTNNQTINGTKTFGTLPEIPTTTPTADSQAASKKYVDDQLNTFPDFDYMEHGRLYTTPGSTTWQAPLGVTKVYVTMVGGGGGGASWSASSNASGGGGAGGEAVIKYPVTVTPGQNYTITVGAGGTAGASRGNNGGDGAASVFGSLSVAGGAGGRADASAGGAATTRSVDASGSSGETPGYFRAIPGGNGGKGGGYDIQNGSRYGGAGGGSAFGQGGEGADYYNHVAQAGSGYGSGGGGSCANSVYSVAAAGAAGFVFIEW